MKESHLTFRVDENTVITEPNWKRGAMRKRKNDTKKREMFNRRSDLGKQIRMFREESGLTQSELAEKVGVEAWVVSKIEKGGRRKIRLIDLERIVAELECRLFVGPC